MLIFLTGCCSPDTDGETIVVTIHSETELAVFGRIAREHMPDVLGDGVGGRQGWEDSRDSGKESHVEDDWKAISVEEIVRSQ